MRKILVVGLGRSGFAAAKLVADNADVTAWDSKAEDKFDAEKIAELKSLGVKCVFGEHPSGEGWDMLILSPGVPPQLEWIQKAKESGAVITGELELSYHYAKGEFVAITGTNGKTTTTTLVGEMFKAAGVSNEVVGNIGRPVADAAKDSSEDTVFVTEVSSFQLETTDIFSPVVSALLNITPDHMDRHKTMEEYRRVKHLVHAHQNADNWFVFNADDTALAEEVMAMDITPGCVPFSHRLSEEELKKLSKGSGVYAFVKEGRITVNNNGHYIDFCGKDELLIPGTHNLENALAASAIAYCAGLKPEVISATLRSFGGVEHRIEFIRELDGVRYVNDSKGTNPDSTEKAIEATKAPILLIAGGYDKGSDFKQLIGTFSGKVEYLLILGVTGPKFAQQAIECGFPEDKIVFCKDMDECVAQGRKLGTAGSTVLLSPACASWDMYTSYEKRGDHFRQLVMDLK